MYAIGVIKQPSFEEMVIKPDELTVTSISFNPSSIVAMWVERMFGSQAIFREWNDTKRAYSYLSPAEMDRRQHEGKEMYFLPSGGKFGLSCSFEILGFVPGTLKHNTITQAGKVPIAKAVYPSIGHAQLKVMNHSSECYYRARSTIYNAPGGGFSSLLLFCPILKTPVCETLTATLSTVRNVSVHLTTYITEGATWDTYIPVVGASTIAADDSSRHSDVDMAVCGVIPYTAKAGLKQRINGAMIYEWIRYYSNLGIKVLLYDRDGAHFPFLFGNAYSKAQQQEERNIEHYNIVYHNYTVGSLLHYLEGRGRFDVTPFGLNARDIMSIDKTMTYTHCRIDASHRYNIDNVIVADFDEFWYCSKGTASAAKQSMVLKRELHRMKQLGIDQRSYNMRVLKPRTGGINELSACIERAVVNASHSIFECWRSYAHATKKISNFKALHSNNACPWTASHTACFASLKARRYDTRLMDCICSCEISGDKCAFVHLALQPKYYANMNPEEKEHDPSVEKKLELYYIANNMMPERASF
eukprot:CAMPEP_0174981380 /NCGR_PEP_ID=MMETSP0004_2-20121128/15858_1 /TAXON_ID=420556 /ORGANISM="Ochromonas sp., Strain CCMP1393" /LENGTH=528 /DNA_ID=CAMNT_0016233119 /DNA_START=70 /DNA_END=1656 /DNA_ORIENTATION=+